MSEQKDSMPPLEWWGGIESTVNRVGDAYFDQIERSGHAARIEDLDRFAALGFRALRYPILWERTAPTGPETVDWRWADERLRRIRMLGMRPIVGLLHHGSGPRYTDLFDPGFPEKLAAYAGAVARRYPWVDRYTPVNEPLTTARFSGMYGYWYPHGTGDAGFCRALLNQCRGISLAMQAIREVNPQAQLIQTEDLGVTFSTPELAYQAEYENNRRWLSLDLLCGSVDRDHPLYDYFTWLGFAESEVDWFLDNPCPPDVMGANFYLTSERLLDHRLERYPDKVIGGNGNDRYADVEAVRVRADGLHGPYGLLRELWDRYRIPLAVTEVHNGCTREEQLRWVCDVYQSVSELRREGIPALAITAWSMLGAFDWTSLLTEMRGDYEPGLFDLRAPEPRPTALARLFGALANGQAVDLPALDLPGWWRRSQRLLYRSVPTDELAQADLIPRRTVRPRRASQPGHSPLPRQIVIFGGHGTLGRALARLCGIRGLPAVVLGRREADITRADSVRRALEAARPWAVINAAGYVRVDEAEIDAEACMALNGGGAAVVARACAERDLPFVTFSTDLVFDGRKGAPYVESDPVAPLGVYGRSKAEAERLVLETCPGALVIRTSAFFGPWDEHNFITVGLRRLAAGERWPAAGDAVVSPTYVPDLGHAALDLLIDGERGIWHLAHTGATTWYDFARLAAGMAGFDPERVEQRTLQELGTIAPRPSYSVLGSERGHLLPALEVGLERFFHDAPALIAPATAETAIRARSE